MRRRTLLSTLASGAIAVTAGCTVRSTRESRRISGPAVALEPVVEGLDFPTAMAVLPDGSALVCERDGRVLHLRDGTIEDDPILDLRERVAGVAGEMGLLGLALHPGVEENGRFYVRYSGDPPTEGSFSHTAVLLEVTMTPSMRGLEPDSERLILEVAQPGPVHNAGDIAFGPDGHLYVPLGDGRRTDIGDEGWSWWHEQGAAAQDLVTTLLGGVLRIDVDGSDADRPYAIPPDNPLVGRPGRDEYFAWGMRNPYRIAFDDDRLFVADVGEHTREAVYLVDRGDNLGWPILEGSSCSPPASVGYLIEESPTNVLNPKTWLAQFNRISPDKLCPSGRTDPASFVDPVIEYQRPGTRAITGGYVYRGENLPELQGSYIFGDLMPPAPLFAAAGTATDERPWPIEELTVTDTAHGRLDASPISFARDHDGELYVLTTRYGEGTGRIARFHQPS